jgi:serine phosphatase RsbU (regulator of sigma subunit)
MLDKIHNLYIHSSYLQDAEKGEKAKLLVNTFLITVLAAYSYALISLVIEFPVGFYVTLILGTCYIFTPFLLRYPNQLFFLSSFYVVSSGSSTFLLIYYSGGISSVVAPWLAITPIAALLYVGRKMAWVAAILMTSAVYYFGIAQYFGQDFTPQYNTQWTIPFDVLALSGFVMIAFLYNLIFEGGRNEAVKIVKEQNKILAENQAEIKAQAEELFQQNEELKTATYLLNKQHDLLSKAHSDIKASINYALRIQQSILPFDEELYAVMPNHFIFYKPRDVVAGDFYWAAQVENKKFLAMIDCTGHGVPGAFMTLIMYNLLNEIIKIQKILQPDEVLNEIRIRILEELKQKQTGNQDGMEISLFAIDTSREVPIVEYASNAPSLIYFQNGEQHIIKSDLIILGGIRNYFPGTKFTLHTIPIDTKTTFYTYSDGIQDQFGGPEGKKFSTKRLKNLLSESQNYEFGKRKEFIEQSIENWTNQLVNPMQVDDMLLIGFEMGNKLQ